MKQNLWVHLNMNKAGKASQLQCWIRNTGLGRVFIDKRFNNGGMPKNNIYNRNITLLEVFLLEKITVC